MSRVLVFVFVFVVSLSVCGGELEERVVASLDGENITTADLLDYVTDVLNSGDSYLAMLGDEKGTGELASWYIDRLILLNYAKSKLSEEDLGGHLMAGMDEDTLYITKILTIEVRDRVVVTDEEIKAAMVEDKTTRDRAYQKLVNEKTVPAYFEFLNRVRSQHEIVFF